MNIYYNFCQKKFNILKENFYNYKKYYHQRNSDNTSSNNNSDNNSQDNTYHNNSQDNYPDFYSNDSISSFLNSIDNDTQNKTTTLIDKKYTSSNNIYKIIQNAIDNIDNN